MRAVSVTLVLLFHAGFTWMRAGYLGVSVFFTLSGFLITSMLLLEHDATGRISVGEFYARRVRRLLPASLTCIVAIVVAAQLGAFSKVPHLRTDLWGAVLQVFNWVQLGGHTSYADLFAGATSPLDHFWSLSIEEQCYWVWPIAVLGLLRVARGRRLVPAMGVVLLVTSGVAVAVARVWGADAAYWATPARLPEIVAGAFLACVLRRGHAVPARAGWLVLPALAGVVALAVVLPTGSGPAYQGYLPLFAVLSATVVYGLQAPGSMRRVLSWRPLVWIGSVSYGLYLFHWPVFVVLRERGWQLETWRGATVAIGITVALATVSSWVIERPVRTRSWAPARSLGLAASATAFAVIVGLVVAQPTSGFAVDETAINAATIAPAASLAPLVPASLAAPASTTLVPVTIAPTTTFEPMLSGKGAPVTTSTTTTTSTSTSTTTTTVVPPAPVTSIPLPAPPSRPVRVLVVGDSTAAAVTVGLAQWAKAHPDQAQVSSRWCPGCGFLVDGTIDTTGLDGSQAASVELVQQQLLDDVARLRPDVVVLMSTLSDVADRTWSTDEGRIGPTDERARERLLQAYLDVTMRLVAAGVGHVVWLVPPVPIEVLNGPEMNEPARYATQHQVIADVVATFGTAQVGSVDVDAWVDAVGHHDDRAWRPDGVHLTPDAATQLAEQFLGPSLVLAALGG